MGATELLKSAIQYETEICVADHFITERQERVIGFDQSIMNDSRVLQIGAGGLGGEISHGLMRKGAGVIEIFDGDTVEPSNLTRQQFFRSDLYKNKAICLRKNLLKHRILKTKIIAHSCMFQKAIQDSIPINCDIVICAPDNDDTRTFVSRFFYERVPVIFTGLDEQANSGYVFIQTPGSACIGCALPHVVKGSHNSCPNTPAIIDLVKIIAGFALFAVDSTVMKRKRNWNFRHIFLDGVPEFLRIDKKRSNCPLCGEKKMT